jgi:hypothetical protein
MIKFNAKKGEDYFSDDDEDLRESNYDDNKVVIMNSKRLKYNVKDREDEYLTQKEIDEENKIYNKELLFERSIENCYNDMKSFSEDNSIELLDKCSYHDFYNFIKKFNK